MIEREIGVFEAKNRLSALLDEVGRGRRIWITRRGRRVALLSSGVAAAPAAGGGLAEAFAGIRAGAKQGKESLKDLIEEGRR